MPTAGEIELENVSHAVVEIEVSTSPLQYLDLIVKDSQGSRLPAFYYGDLFSPLDTPYFLRLQPGQKYTGPVSLLGNVPEEEQRPGRYTVQAVYQYKELRTVSEPFPIELTPRCEANAAARPAVTEVASEAE